MNGLTWTFVVLAGLFMFFLIIFNFYLALDDTSFNKYCEERNSREVKEKKMRRGEIIEKLLEKVEDLSDRLESLTIKYEQASKDLEYLKFKQATKGDILVSLVNYPIPDGTCCNDPLTHTHYKNEDDTEGVTVSTPIYPVLKYLKNGRVVTLESTDIMMPNVVDKIVATRFPQDQYIIKIIPEEKYYKCKPVHMFADLRRYRFTELTIEHCQALGIDFDIDKGRKWVEI